MFFINRYRVINSVHVVISTDFVDAAFQFTDVGSVAKDGRSTAVGQAFCFPFLCF